MKKLIRVVCGSVLLLAVLFVSFSVAEVKQQSGVPYALFDRMTELIVLHEYGDAFSYIEEVCGDDEMLRSFMTASVLHAEMGDFESNCKAALFYAAADMVEKLAGIKLSDNPNDGRVYFYRGLTRAYRGVVMNRGGSLFKAAKKALSGVGDLEKAEELLGVSPEISFPLAVFSYWKSAKNFFRILPGISDNRAHAVKKMQDNLDESASNYALSINQLAWIYLDMKNPQKALEILAKGMKRFPRSRFFLYPSGVAAMRVVDYDSAINFFELVADTYNETDLLLSMPNRIRLKTAQCYFELGKYDSAQKYAESLISETAEIECDTLKKVKKQANNLLIEIDKIRG